MRYALVVAGLLLLPACHKSAGTGGKAALTRYYPPMVEVQTMKCAAVTGGGVTCVVYEAPNCTADATPLALAEGTALSLVGTAGDPGSAMVLVMDNPRTNDPVRILAWVEGRSTFIPMLEMKKGGRVFIERMEESFGIIYDKTSGGAAESYVIQVVGVDGVRAGKPTPLPDGFLARSVASDGYSMFVVGEQEAASVVIRIDPDMSFNEIWRGTGVDRVFVDDQRLAFCRIANNELVSEIRDRNGQGQSLPVPIQPYRGPGQDACGPVACAGDTCLFTGGAQRTEEQRIGAPITDFFTFRIQERRGAESVELTEDKLPFHLYNIRLEAGDTFEGVMKAISTPVVMDDYIGFSSMHIAKPGLMLRDPTSKDWFRIGTGAPVTWSGGPDGYQGFILDPYVGSPKAQLYRLEGKCGN